MRFYNQSVAAAASGDFELILYRTETEELDYAAWCGGYLTGVDLAETDWYDAGDPDEVGELLFPLLVLADALPEEEKRSIKPAEWRRIVALVRGVPGRHAGADPRLLEGAARRRR